MKRIFQCCKSDDRLLVNHQELEQEDHNRINTNAQHHQHFRSESTFLVTNTAARQANDITLDSPNEEQDSSRSTSTSIPRDLIVVNTTNETLDNASDALSDTFSTVSSKTAMDDSQELLRIAQVFENGIKVSNKRYHFKTYKRCFVAREAVDFLVKNQLAKSRKEAVQVGLALQNDLQLIEHVCREHDFQDAYLFFRVIPKKHRLVSIQDDIGCLMHMSGGNALLGETSSVDSSSVTSMTLSSFGDVRSTAQLASAFEQGMTTKDIRYHLKTYKNVFVGSDAVDYMVCSGLASSRRKAVELGKLLTRDCNLFSHVFNHHEFKDDYLFFQFTPQQERFHAQEDQYKSLVDIANLFEKGVKVRHVRYRMKIYKNVFVGSKVVDWMTKTKLARTRRDAVKLGRKLMHKLHLFEHVCQEHDFHDDYYFYKFVPVEQRIDEFQQDEDESIRSMLQQQQQDGQSSVTSSSFTTGNDSSRGLLLVANEFRRGVTVKNHSWRLKTYRNTFVASEAVDFLINSSFAETRKEAVALGRSLQQDAKLFEHVTGEHVFKDDYLFFRFSKKENDETASQSMRSESFVSDITGGSITLEQMAQEFRANMKVQDHKYHLKTYKNTFVGRQAVDFLVREGLAETRDYAVELGRQMQKKFGLFEHVTQDHALKDGFFFYRFVNMGELTPAVVVENEEAMDIVMLLDVGQLHEIGVSLEEGVPVGEHRRDLCVYKNTFTGKDAVDFLTNQDPLRSRAESVQIGRTLARDFNLFEEVHRNHDFKDDEVIFYRFNHESERFSWDVKDIPKSLETLEETTQETTPETILTEYDVPPTPRPSLVVTGKSKSLRPMGFKHRERNALMDELRRYSMPVLMKRLEPPQQQELIAERVKTWSSTFRREDPRYQILSAVNTVACHEAYSLSKGLDPKVIADLLRNTSREPSVFSVWRPTSFDAIRRMMLGEATGKGLDIKGKSAKRGKMKAFVPFLQISENKHKSKVRTLPKDGRVRLFFRHKRARDIASSKLESVTHEMIAIVDEAKQVLADSRADKDSYEDALDSMLLDVTDPSIYYDDEYAPKTYGLDIPMRLFWEAYFCRQDISRKPGSEYDTGRPSLPAFQDMNFASLRSKDKGGTRAVVMQLGDTKSAMNPFELVMAYEENDRVLPVVSDFDCFLVGTRNVKFAAPLPTEQVEVLNWMVGSIENILDAPPSPHSWTNRWLQVLHEASKEGFRPRIPRLGFGDPTSYRTMENAIQRLTRAGPVRHGPECFNYCFPQELDEEYLVISDILPGNLSWMYLDVKGLQDFLSIKVDEGYVFPLNPKQILCDSGEWKGIYDKLMRSQNPYVQEALNVWYPKDSGVRDRIETIHSRHPGGFHRESADLNNRLKTNEDKLAASKISHDFSLKSATQQLDAESTAERTLPIMLKPDMC